MRRSPSRPRRWWPAWRSPARSCSPGSCRGPSSTSCSSRASSCPSSACAPRAPPRGSSSGRASPRARSCSSPSCGATRAACCGSARPCRGRRSRSPARGTPSSTARPSPSPCSSPTPSSAWGTIPSPRRSTGLIGWRPPSRSASAPPPPGSSSRCRASRASSRRRRPRPRRPRACLRCPSTRAARPCGPPRRRAGSSGRSSPRPWPGTSPGSIRRLFPIFDNLDAVFLGGSREGLQKLPGTGPSGRFSLRPELARARRTADPAALARLRAAATATVGALGDVLPLVRAGARQAEVGDALRRAMTARGCGPESFPPIASSGKAAAAPHGDGNQGVLGAGEVVVMDFGCSVDQYASDFTRTLPVDGRFTPRQRVLYDAVFAAQAAALAACRPGVRLGGRGKGEGGESLDAIARKVLRERTPDHEEHMPHGLGHTVGLFVHDVMLEGALKEGDVVTIEPGTYLEGELGIRIEDTVLVTATGCEPITTGFPADADAVEAAMAKVAAAGKGRP
ncbi:MAG: M24 family metallopeptidase [Anaeromyxobacteraceae bacterium]